MSERQERLQNRLQPEIREFRDGLPHPCSSRPWMAKATPMPATPPSCCREDGYYVLISRDSPAMPATCSRCPRCR